MPLNTELKQIVEQKFKSRCIVDLKPHSTLHHILPKSLGGLDEEDNLVPLCYECHDRIHKSGAGLWVGYLRKLRDKRLNEYGTDDH